jgi:tryptophan synthase beta subunit
MSSITVVSGGDQTAGRFGGYGGRYVPESLIPACQAVADAFATAWADPGFRGSLARLLCAYAGRPTPLTPALRLSAELGVTVLLKREDLTHTGSHKINNVMGQALLARRMGRARLIAETGAGMHGVATATAGALLGLPVRVFMGERDVERQSHNVFRMRLLGAEVVPVSTFAGFVDTAAQLVGVEAEGGSGAVNGEIGVLHGFQSLFLQDDHGQIKEAHSIAAGLDYPGVGPEHAYLRDLGRARYVTVSDAEAIAAAVRLARTEGILPAIESAHALAWVIRAAGTSALPGGSNVLITLSGRGDKDVTTLMKEAGL